MGMLLHFNDAERELNARLKPHLHSIHASLKLDQDITDANVAILKTILDDIYEQIKRNDPLFKKICRRLVYTGSYYIRLRTKKADEFDINLVLDLPFRKGEFTILDERPGYVGYKVSPAAVNRLLREGEKEWVHPLLKLINGENRLVPERVKRSLQSAFDRVLQTYVIPSGLRSSVARIRPSQSGPAKTFRIILKDCQWIDVDLVPVIEFRYPNWPSGIEKKDWMDKISPVDRNWFLVPKSPMSNPSMPDGSHLWRLDFQNMENRLIQGYGCVKPIIRLLKTTRDSYTWNLSSYSLKTFVMHQLLAKYDRGYWDPKNQGILFITVLESLGHALDQPGPAIPFLFHPKVDLTEKIKIPTKRNISGTIKHIVRKLRESPDRCCELILGESGTPAPPNDVTQEAKFIPYMVHQTENSGGAWRCLIS